MLFKYLMGLPWWLSGKESTCQCRRCGFDPWVGKIPWRRKCQPTPVFLPGKSHGQRSLAGYSAQGRKESDMTQQLNNNKCVCVCVHTWHILGLQCLTLYACPRGITRSKKWKKGTGYHEEVSAVSPCVTYLNMHQIHFTSISRCLCTTPSYEAGKAEVKQVLSFSEINIRS